MSAAYGLDPAQLAFRIIRPLLKNIGLWSPAAEQLVLGTGMQESRLHYMSQLGGPALGIYQMEPATHADIRRNYLSHQVELARVADDWAIGEPDAEEMQGNLYYATAMCRVHYRRVKAALPNAGDEFALARYWKHYYNTPLGAGSIAQALPHFARAAQIFSTGASS